MLGFAFLSDRLFPFIPHSDVNLFMLRSTRSFLPFLFFNFNFYLCCSTAAFYRVPAEDIRIPSQLRSGTSAGASSTYFSSLPFSIFFLLSSTPCPSFIHPSARTHPTSLASRHVSVSQAGVVLVLLPSSILVPLIFRSVLFLVCVGV